MALALCLLLAACGGGGIVTTTPDPSTSTGTTKEFALGSDYPANLVIPDDPTMTSTAFVVSVDQPVGVLAIELNSTPLTLSQRFAGCLLPAGTGLPSGALQILGPTAALLLTSSHLVYCNPSTGKILHTLDLRTSITLPAPAPLSRAYDANGDGVAEQTIQSFVPSFPGGLTLSGNTIYVSFSNYLVAIGNPVAAPGLVLAYQLQSTAPYLVRAASAPLVTSAYNPSGLRTLRDGRVLIINSGVNTIENAQTVPITTAGVNIYDPTTGALQWIPIGPAALSFHTPPLTPDERYALLPSAAFKALFVIDLETQTVRHGLSNPIVVDGKAVGSDFLPTAILDPTGNFLYAASFSQSAIYPVVISETTPRAATPAEAPVLVLGFPAGVSPQNPSGTNTGVSALAFRPGRRGTDFQGPDLFALTANPGKLVGVDSQLPVTLTPNVGTNTAPSTNPTPSTSPPPTSTPPTSAPSSSSDNGAGPATSPEPYDPPASSELPFADHVAWFDAGPGSGFGASYYPGNVLDRPEGAATSYSQNANGAQILSLGCGGEIILEMQDLLIADGPGADFIVFENAFYIASGGTFSEPGIVGVSDDGVLFYDYPCPGHCAGMTPTFTTAQNGIDPTDPAKAGGDAFDLAAVDLERAAFVRIRDANTNCSGAIGTTLGFDLDAVSVVWGMLGPGAPMTF